ncbi:DUF262 domain-containing protein [Cellulosimicrobium protaetiae]|uniref:DUF262 domain-containing protein n=1 Tax=Cellulosimicrobium protaetiae TaxID=2587808 RepID=A0A6M5UD05_9MICO|nr:DUF262 domain-containing protein [Cellulosimicrobium protaetiae]QJW35492.1 DUF262 domain-containing protein [Cellulosimicrobium protaetiae]
MPILPTVDSDRRTLESTLAESLAALSQHSPEPDGVIVARAFDAVDIDFGSEAWVDYLELVQDWLRLDQRIESFLSTKEVLRDLFSCLGKGGLHGNVEVNGISLTQQGLEALLERVERANALREKFLGDLEEVTPKVASDRWYEAWDEASVATSREPIRAKADTWTIQNFVAKAERDKLELNPTYQRGDVWPTKDAQLLIESILRGIPLPSIIVLRPDSIASSPYEVVDGKQRLTSILRFVGKHPSALRTVREVDKAHPGFNLEHLFRTNYPSFRQAWKAATGESLTLAEERRLYFPFPLAKDFGEGTELARMGGRFFHQVQDEVVLVGGGEATIYDVFEGTTDYKVPIIEYLEATPRQVHEVFNLYNKQGKHLNAEEIRNAVFHELDIMRAFATMAGDGPGLEVATPFLAPAEADVHVIREYIAGCGMSADRFKRTKVVSWLSSLAVSDPTERKDQQDGAVVRKQSTARHIDTFLERVGERNDPMRTQSRIRELVALLGTAMRAHGAIVWPESLRGKTTGWEELPLVATLLGTTFAAAVLGERTDDRMREREVALQSAAATGWLRPAKTQTGLQWAYIADTALGIVDALGVPSSTVDAHLRSAFVHSPVEAFRMVRADERLMADLRKNRKGS